MMRSFLAVISFVFATVLVAQDLVDKKELDERITTLIMQGSAERIVPRDYGTLQLHHTDSAGVLSTQGSIYMIDQISDDLYYLEHDDTIQVLWDRQFPCQSMTNLLLGQVANPEFVIDLTHRRYGLVHPRFDVSWSSLYHTLCTEGIRQYASALVREDGAAIRGILVLHQPQGNYLHMLVITTTVDELFQSQSQRPVLKADLFTNVPQHNILNLYE